MDFYVLFIISRRSFSYLANLFPFFKQKGWEVKVCEDLEGAFKLIKKRPPLVIFSEAYAGKFSSEVLLKERNNVVNFPEVIVFSEKGSSEEAKVFLDLGARDFWLLPFVWEKIELIVEFFIGQQKLRTGERRFQNRERVSSFFIGEDKKIKKAVALAKKVAFSDATVLIYGESGTGKEVLARLIHSFSPRKDKPFVAVNCAALPVHLLESELFGYERGAFTGAVQRKPGKFELADGGTLLLDEISEMDISLQAKLLRVIQEKEIDRLGGTHSIKVDVRILATTNKNLEEKIKKGEFREDLYYRINVIPIFLPPLRERIGDAVLLAEHFIEEFCKKYSFPVKRLSDKAIKWIREFDWPGNVRQLRNYMERAVLLCDGDTIEPEHFDVSKLDLDEASEEKDKGFNKPHFTGGSGREEILPLYEVEKRMILKSLDYTGGNRTKAAELLGISVRTLRNKLNEYKRKGEI